MLTCNHCGSSNPDSSRFCNHCGSKIGAGAAAGEGLQRIRSYTPQHLVEQVLKTRAALQGERKRVTVLFADLKGSTHLAEQAGEEAWHGIIDRYFAILGAVVHRYEGTINQYTGDGIMALFGAPVAHEDHAQRACHAALSMQRELRGYANELRMTLGLNLAMRIGINTGDVIVGSIGDDLRMDYTAQGLTVNLAARMEHICEPGRAYCTRATAALVEGYFRLREIGAMAVEGASAPVQVYEVEAVGTIQTRLDRALARGAARFVGRERELRRLREAIDRVHDGQGNIIVVTGGAGVGKSRLCHEFAIECERRGIPVHRAAGVPYASALPLHPILALTRSRLGIAPGASAADARRLAAGGLLLFDANAATLLPQMLEFLGIDDGTAQLSRGAPDRSSLQGFLARFLARTDEPQVLLVEDLHFADAGTEAMLDALCGELAGSRTLLLLNFRPEYADGWLQAHAHERVALAVLNDAQIETLASELLGVDPSLTDLAQRLGARAAGNPFFVEEAVQALKESGHLQGTNGAYRLMRAIDDEWPIPDTVQALVAARIDRLDEAGKNLLQTAAVIGQDFDARTLSRLSGVDIEACRQQLSVLVRKGLVGLSDGADGDYVFSHPLIQDVAYRTQLERTRAATHARLAAQLEEDHPPTAPPTEAAVGIAHHWRRAAEWARAAQWNLLAAQWRSTQDAPTTLKQYRLALEHTRRAPASAAVNQLRVMALTGLLRLATFINLPIEEADQIYDEARSVSEALGNTALLAEVLISWSVELLHRGDAAAAMRIAEEFVDRALAADARDLVRRYRVALLLTCATAGEPAAGVQLIAKGDGSGWLTAAVDEDNYMSRGFYSLLQAWTGHLPAAREHLDAALAYAEQGQRAASWMYAFRVDLAWISGNYAGVLAQAQIALQRAEAYGSPYFRAVALRALGLAHVLQGDAASALPLLEQMRPLIAKGGPAHQFEAHSLAVLARAYCAAGQLQEAFDNARAAIASGQRTRARLWEIAAWLALFEIPGDGPWHELIEEGISRVDTLIAATGADSARPWWWLARARLAQSPAEHVECRSRAIEAFLRIGAEGHVQRLSVGAMPAA